jgi:hypothetical protein
MLLPETSSRSRKALFTRKTSERRKCDGRCGPKSHHGIIIFEGGYKRMMEVDYCAPASFQQNSLLGNPSIFDFDAEHSGANFEIGGISFNTFIL